MKLEDLAYTIIQRVFHELEHTHHFTVPDNVKKAVMETISGQLNSMIK